MWKLLMITYVLLDLAVKGLAQGLMVKIDGETTMRRKFCVGEQLTFFCTIRSSAYQWKAGTILSGSDGQVFIGNTLQFGKFTLSAQGSGEGRNSSLEVAAFSGLDGVLITCEEVGNTQNSQTTIVTLLDMQCPTDISADVYDNCSSADVSFTATNCTQRYIVSGSNNMPDIFSSYLLVNDSGRLLNTGRFNLSNSSLVLCSLYNITVIAILFDESNMTCPTVPIVPITSVNPSSTTQQDPTMTSRSSIRAITAIVVSVILLVVVISVVVLVIVIMIMRCKRKKSAVSSTNPFRSSHSRPPPPPGVIQLNANEPVVYSTVKSPQEDFLPTYQDPQSIQHDEVPDGSVYYMVDKKKGRGFKKKSEKKEELPLYSIIDKNKDVNAQEGLVYTDISVRNTSRSSRSRLPPPPGVTQLYASEPVVYSTVETPQQWQ